MKKLFLIILSLSFISSVCGQNKKENIDILKGQIKVIINQIDTISTTDRPLLFIDKKLYYEGIDSVVFFEMALPKKEIYSLEIKGWGYRVDSVINSKSMSLNDLILYGNIDCEVSHLVAEKDIESDNIRLLIIGGIVPKANTYQDNEFQKKYSLTYFDYGDTPPLFDCVRKYNENIFEFLDSKFGIEWRAKVRRDVEGL